MVGALVGALMGPLVGALVGALVVVKFFIDLLIMMSNEKLKLFPKKTIMSRIMWIQKTSIPWSR